LISTDDEPTFRADPGDRRFNRRERPERSYIAVIAALILTGAVAIGVWVWWSDRAATPAPVTESSAPATTASTPDSPTAAAPAEPAVNYPLPLADATQPMSINDIVPALTELLGRKAVDSFLQTDDFARRLVVTIDNLGREHAPAAVWPVSPSPGRFLVEQRVDGTVIAAGNAARYTPLVLLAETIDAKDSVKLYRRMYPLLQQAYRELGFGDRYLNDRVVEVIDLLLATPEPTEAPRLQLTEVKGPIPSQRPWIHYQYEDPRLEGLAAGQKILIRVGLANERRLKSKLAELRGQLVQTPQQPAPAR
jgi:hypothetical protein